MARRSINRALVAKASVAAAAEPRWPYDPPDGREYAWGEPENLGRGVNYGKRDLNPRLTADELTLIYNRGTELFTARRSSRDESFGQCELLSGPVQSVGSETSSLTGDGLELYLGSSTSDRHIWVSTRSSIEKPFGELVETRISGQLEPPGRISDHIVRRPDACYHIGRPDPSKSASSDVYLFRRRSRAEPFGGATNLGRDVNIAKMITPNWISSDGLVLFSTVMKKQPWLYLWRARRSTDDPFSPGVPFGEPFVGPIGPGGAWLSLDGRRMYFQFATLPAVSAIWICGWPAACRSPALCRLRQPQPHPDLQRPLNKRCQAKSPFGSSHVCRPRVSGKALAAGLPRTKQRQA